MGLAHEDLSPRPGGEIVSPGDTQAVSGMGFWSVGSFTPRCSTADLEAYTPVTISACYYFKFGFGI